MKHEHAAIPNNATVQSAGAGRDHKFERSLVILAGSVTIGGWFGHWGAIGGGVLGLLFALCQTRKAPHG